MKHELFIMLLLGMVIGMAMGALIAVDAICDPLTKQGIHSKECIKTP